MSETPELMAIQNLVEGRDKSGRFRRNLLLLQSLSEYRRVKLGTRAEEIRTEKITFNLSFSVVVGLLIDVQLHVHDALIEENMIDKIDKMAELFEYMSRDEVYASMIKNNAQFYKSACKKFRELYETVIESYPFEKHKFMPYVDMFRYDVVIPFSDEKPICLDTLDEKTCMICYDANVTCQTNCRHNYCEKCINAYFACSDQTNCPYCRSTVTCFTRIV